MTGDKGWRECNELGEIPFNAVHGLMFLLSFLGVIWVFAYFLQIYFDY